MTSKLAKIKINREILHYRKIMVSSLKELIEEPGLVNAEDPEAKFTKWC